MKAEHSNMYNPPEADPYTRGLVWRGFIISLLALYAIMSPLIWQFVANNMESGWFMGIDHDHKVFNVVCFLCWVFSLVVTIGCSCELGEQFKKLSEKRLRWIELKSNN